MMKKLQMRKLQWIAALALFLGGLLLVATPAVHAEPALWVVKGPHSTVYLFGSVHVLKKDQPWRSPKIDAAIRSSGNLWLEIPDGDDAKAMQPLVLKLGVDAEHPLSSRLSKDQIAKLDTVAKAAGVPNGEAALEPLRPWLAAITLSVAPMVRAGYDPNSGVEQVLKPEFAAAHKPLHGFETMEQQLHFFSDLPEKTQEQFLNSTVDDFDEATDKFGRIVAAWYAGDLSTLDTLFSGEFRDKYPDLYKVLIVDRNEGFTKQIAGLLNGDGISFVAVGAGHLVGADGVPAMLEKLGYRVERQ